MRYSNLLLAMSLGYAVNATAQVKTTDSVFIHHSRPIEFVVNKINVSDADRRWITDSLIPQLRALGDRGIILGRATPRLRDHPTTTSGSPVLEGLR